jgi:hypothetical protein
MSTSTPTSTDQGINISSGAIAGIIIGAVFVLAGTAIGFFWFTREKKRRVSDFGGQRQEPDCAPSQQQVQSVKSQQHTPQPSELLATDLARELPAHEDTDEGVRAEMQG